MLEDRRGVSKGVDVLLCQKKKRRRKKLKEINTERKRDASVNGHMHSNAACVFVCLHPLLLIERMYGREQMRC